MRAGDLKTIHWSTATVSSSSSLWIVMSPPKKSNENGDTSVQSYRKIWGNAGRWWWRAMCIMTNALNLVLGGDTVLTHHAQHFLCCVDWKCPTNESVTCVSLPTQRHKCHHALNLTMCYSVSPSNPTGAHEKWLTNSQITAKKKKIDCQSVCTCSQEQAPFYIYFSQKKPNSDLKVTELLRTSVR